MDLTIVVLSVAIMNWPLRKSQPLHHTWLAAISLALLSVASAEEAAAPMLDREGNEVALKAPEGKKLHVVFWCSWCAIVNMQVGQIATELKTELAAGDAIIGLSKDRNTDDHDKAIAARGDTMAGWRHILADQEAANQFFNDLGIVGLPAVAVYDDAGQRIALHTSLRAFLEARKPASE